MGWVPTVTGNLSFSALGRGSFPSRCLRVDTPEVFVIYQKRDLLDVLVPYADDVNVAKFFREKIANLALKISGQFSFVMIATPEKLTECCTGKIYLVAHAHNNRALKEAKKAFRQSEPTNDARELFELAVSQMSCYETKFELQRQGRLKISADDTTSVGGILANQTFFFVKDIAHVHQHHDPRHDAITEMTPHTDEFNAEWISKTQQALYRSIIRYKRFRNEKALFRASGILAYTQAFQNSYVRPPKAIADGKKYHQTELEQSLEVSRSEIKHFDQKRLAKIETFRNFFFALFGLAMSVTFLARLGGPVEVEVDDRIVDLAILLAQNPIEAVGATFLASSVWMVATHQQDPADSEIVRWITRLTQSFRLRYFMLSNVVITGLLATASYYLITMSIN